MQIESLKSQVEKLELELAEKNKLIDSITPLRDELSKNISEIKEHKEEYKRLVDEVRKMKEIMNQTIYKNRWKLIKFLLK